MTAPVFALAVLILGGITATTMYLRRHPIWQGPGVRHPGSPPRPPRQYPAPRDWGQSRLPSAADRTAQFAAIAADRGCRAELCKYWPGDGCMRGVMPCEDDGDAAPWDAAPEPVTPEPDLPPLPDRYIPSPARACPDAPPALTLRDLTPAEERDLAQRFRDAFSEPGGSVCTECADGYCRDCAPAPDDTATDMRPVPARVAAAENAAARWHLKAHVSHTLAWTPPLRRYVEDTIGTSPAEDWDRLLEQARAGAVSDGG